MSSASKSGDDKRSSDDDQNDPVQYDGTALKKLLDHVNPAGSFATSGTFEPSSLSPKIVVDGVGTIGLPLHPLVAGALKEKAEKAPFGRGPATLVDESVRRAWQIDPKNVSVDGVDWDDTLAALVKKAAYELGISNENVEKLEIKANLYKVLLYEEGGHFKPHKDTVKEDGMFGTLVVQLPSQFGGSSSIVVHQGESKTFELAKDCESTFQYMAFYADCEHEILPITDGWRFCLVYNLVVTKPNESGVLVLPDANQMLVTTQELQAEVAKWLISGTGKLGYPLDHEYTLDSYGFGKMKGRDAVVLSVLRNAVDATGVRLFELALAIFYHEEYYGSYDGKQEYGVEEVLLEDGTLKNSESSPDRKKHKPNSNVWVDNVLYRGKDGLLRELESLPEEEQEKIQEWADSGEVDIGNEHEADVTHHDAGNEGGGRTTWYRSACLVFFPASNVELNQTVVSLCSNMSAQKSE